MEHIVWNVDPILINIGFLKIRWYGLMFASAFIFGYSMMQWIYQREGKIVEELDRMLWYWRLALWSAQGLAHCLFYDPGYYLANPLKILAIWEGGLASHGGIIGIFWLCIFINAVLTILYLWLLDRVAFPCTMSGCFIRIGNFFNSEILGTVTDRPWGVIFARVDDLPRHPVQFYEAFCYALIFFFLLAVYKKTYDKPIKGLLFGLVIFLVFVVRILLEFFKTEQAMYDTGLPFTAGQLLSFPFLLVGGGFIYWSIKNYRAITAR